MAQSQSGKILIKIIIVLCLVAYSSPQASMAIIDCHGKKQAVPLNPFTMPNKPATITVHGNCCTPP